MNGSSILREISRQVGFRGVSCWEGTDTYVHAYMVRDFGFVVSSMMHF